MQVRHKGYRIRGFYRVAQIGYRWAMRHPDCYKRLKILSFFDKHGLAATQDAFGVSRRTLYRWKAALKAAGGDASALTPRSCAPKRKRRPTTDPRLVEAIRRLRNEYPNLGKEKLHVLLQPWCLEEGIRLPSVSTIGRIIARDPHKMRLVPRRLHARGRVKPMRRVRKMRRPKGFQGEPLEVFATDTIERFRDGQRAYLLTLIDPVSRFACACAVPSKSSRYTAAALKAILSLLPSTPRVLLSDNGSEFERHFADTAQAYGIQRWYTYPKTPKMNAHCERFNRTLQETFVDYHEDLLFTNLKEFNRKLAQWLLAYNTVLPHHSLNGFSPLQFLIQHNKKCQRY